MQQTNANVWIPENQTGQSDRDAYKLLAHPRREDHLDGECFFLELFVFPFRF